MNRRRSIFDQAADAAYARRRAEAWGFLKAGDRITAVVNATTVLATVVEVLKPDVLIRPDGQTKPVLIGVYQFGAKMIDTKGERRDD